MTVFAPEGLLYRLMWNDLQEVNLKVSGVPGLNSFS